VALEAEKYLTELEDEVPEPSSAKKPGNDKAPEYKSNPLL
jgi:hypothetical protein